MVTHIISVIMFLGFYVGHGTSQLLSFPYAGIFLLFPVVILLGDRIFRLANITSYSEYDCEIQKHYYSPRLKVGNSYCQPGQYVLLNSRNIHGMLFEWHPFTISSNIDGTITFHIQVKGKKKERTWTSAFRRRLKSRPELPPVLNLDGPFSTPSSRALSQQNIVLICEGFGVTPMLSLWLHFCKSDSPSRGKRVYFLWSCPHQPLLVDIYNEIVLEDIPPLFKVEIHGTRGATLSDILLQQRPRQVTFSEGRVKVIDYFENLLRDLEQRDCLLESNRIRPRIKTSYHVHVFYCGTALRSAVEEEISEIHSSDSRYTFHLHTEMF